jgi:hypothetical protein
MYIKLILTRTGMAAMEEQSANIAPYGRSVMHMQWRQKMDPDGSLGSGDCLGKTHNRKLW